MTNFLDSLVMLLSTDWFRPHWSVIGINLDDPKQTLMREGCRKIVDQIISGATDYWLTSFSDDRYRDTTAMVESLAQISDAREAVIETVEEWSRLSDEDLKAGWLFESLTQDLLSDDANQNSSELSSNLKIIVGLAHGEQSAEIDFTKLSSNSRSAWDQYIRKLTPDLPTFLPDMLFTFLQAQTFKAFWTSVVSKLTPEQRGELTAWYRANAKSRAKRDIAPSYFPGVPPLQT